MYKNPNILPNKQEKNYTGKVALTLGMLAASFIALKTPTMEIGNKDVLIGDKGTVSTAAFSGINEVLSGNPDLASHVKSADVYSEAEREDISLRRDAPHSNNKIESNDLVNVRIKESVGCKTDIDALCGVNVDLVAHKPQETVHQ